MPIVLDKDVRKRALSLATFVKVVSGNAAKIFSLYPRKGIITRGSDADIVLTDPHKKHSLNAADVHIGMGLTMCKGRVVIGYAVITILREKRIAENDELIEGFAEVNSSKIRYR